MATVADGGSRAMVDSCDFSNAHCGVKILMAEWESREAGDSKTAWEDHGTTVMTL